MSARFEGTDAMVARHGAQGFRLTEMAALLSHIRDAGDLARQGFVHDDAPEQRSHQIYRFLHHVDELARSKALASGTLDSNHESTSPASADPETGPVAQDWYDKHQPGQKLGCLINSGSKRRFPQPNHGSHGNRLMDG